jgi:hypothetical protein
MSYTDARGVSVPDERIQELLQVIGKSEQEVIEFIGSDYAKIPGAFYYFIEMLATQKQYYV